MRQGLQAFVLETITPLNRVVGEAWMRGDLQVFEEHLYTEQLQAALRTGDQYASRARSRSRACCSRPFPTEQHGLGLLMVEALLVPEGVHAYRSGRRRRWRTCARGARAQGAHRRAVVLGRVPAAAGHRRLGIAAPQLPATVQCWAGGEMTRRVRKTLPGIVLIPDLAASVNALRSWRAHWVPPAA
jgi:hypothetical protein